MPHFADPVRAPSSRKSAAKPAAAARPQPRRVRPSQQAALWQVLQRKAAGRDAAAPARAPAAPSRGGLPERLRAGIEHLSGLAMDDVRVHRDSAEPARLGALAYTQGSDIHLGPDQEEHLPHEAWHVVQQKQRRVGATTQMKGIGLNDSAALESEADAMGRRASAHSVPPGPAPAAVPSHAGGAIQLKKFVPSEQGCTAAVQGNDVPGIGKDLPNMWSFTLASSEKDALPSRDAALARASEIYSKVGADTANGFFMTRYNVDLNRAWFLSDVKMFVPGWDAIDLNEYRNIPAFNALDPFVLTTKLEYSHKEKETDQAKKIGLELRTQFANEFTGYIIGVKDTELGIDDTMEKRNKFNLGWFYNDNRPAKATFSNMHHVMATKSVKDLLPATKTQASGDREAGVDAITKLVAEGGRFVAVKAMGSDLADDTVFHTAWGQKRRGVKFSDLWGCWKASFDKQYSVSVGDLKTKVSNVTLAHSSKSVVVYDFTELPKGAEHFDLDTGKKGRGEVVVAPVQPPPPQQTKVVVSELQQQPKASNK